MNDEEYRNRLKKVQDIVNWKDEERVGLIECRKLGKLPITTLSDIRDRSRNLPENVDIFIFGGLADIGETRHDIDVYIVNNSDKSKDTINSEVNKVLLRHKGRMNRVYNLDKFEKDKIHLKKLIERFDKSDISEKTNLCDEMNPILEIHSHCKEDEKVGDFGSECLAKNIAEMTDINLYKCNRKGCKYVKKNRLMLAP